jgi:endonuclease YncB( thermonuclease family)
MSNVDPFRRLRWGSPRQLATPDVLRARPRLAGLRGHYGLIAVALLIVCAALLLGREGEFVAGRTIAGARVTVVDGDSLRLGRESIRLKGIDAPELRQTCLDDAGREWRCGQAAKSRLAALAAAGAVSCTARGHDRYGRTLATCAAGDVADLGEALVREGLAVDYGGFHSLFSGYSAAEREARAARRGIWAGTFEPPQDFRRRHPRSD